MTNTEKLGMEPAFPVDGDPYSGMSKRFYAACAAMQGLLSGDELVRTGRRKSESIIELAYKHADELLKQEGTNS
jgi:hypothetical protein